MSQEIRVILIRHADKDELYTGKDEQEEQDDMLAGILEEAKQAGINLEGYHTVAVVGHEARLSWLLTRLTSSRTRPSGLPAIMQTPQELHYRIGTGSWVKFADVPMTVTLRKLPGPLLNPYEVETRVNNVPSVQPYTGPT